MTLFKNRSSRLMMFFTVSLATTGAAAWLLSCPHLSAVLLTPLPIALAAYSLA